MINIDYKHYHVQKEVDESDQMEVEPQNTPLIINEVHDGFGTEDLSLTRLSNQEHQVGVNPLDLL
jgi:hypothetical protein